jgi:hypothetical protein
LQGRTIKEDKLMKYQIPVAAAAVAVLMAGCNARSAANNVIVAGCVQSAEQGLASPGDKKDIDKFMLTNASLASTAAPASSPSPNDSPTADRPRADQAPNDVSAPAPAAPTASASMYILDGKTSELRDHLNQKVEITGRLDHDNAKDSTANPRQELHVDSIRALAENCNP